MTGVGISVTRDDRSPNSRMLIDGRQYMNIDIRTYV